MPKPLMATLISLLLCVTNYAQVSTWQRIIGTAGNDVANKVLVADDGNFLVSGYSNGFDTAGTYDFHIVKLDSLNGQVIWWQHVNSGFEDYSNSMCLTKTGEIIVAGYSRISSMASNDVMLAKLSKSGTVIWQKIFSTPDNDFGW